MKRMWLGSIACVALTGCDEGWKYLGKAMDAQFGIERQTVALARPGTLPAGTSSFHVSRPLKFLGDGGLCVGLVNGVDLRNATPTSPVYKAQLGNRELEAELILASGTRVPLESSNPAWNRYGQLGGKGELSACMWSHAGFPANDPVVGAEITNRAVPFVHRGVYWYSESQAKTVRRRS